LEKDDTLNEIKSISPPRVSDGISSLELYIKRGRIIKLSEIEIQQNLLNNGWSINVVNAFMGKKDE